MAGQQFLGILNGVKKLFTAVQVGGVGNANLIPALSASGLLDVTMMPSGIGPNTAVVTSSEAIAAGALVNLYSNAGVINVRNADNTNTSKVINGFVLSAIASSASGTIYLSGQITGLTGLTPGTLYYLGTVGGTIVASALPTSTGTLIQSVGVALSSTVLEFSPGDPVTQ